MRGAPFVQYKAERWEGIIPACAGSTGLDTGTLEPRRDHPRMCGEHDAGIVAADFSRGSSPHVRGARRRRPRPCAQRGIIPACAGSTLNESAMTSVLWDHPRMCGEHVSVSTLESYCVGSSPHVRGARNPLLPRQLLLGIIPACAGSTMRQTSSGRSPRDHPRMCGEHYKAVSRETFDPGSSPHVRGALSAVHDACDDLGIIPACAGSTR